MGPGGLSPKHLAAGVLPPKQLAAGPPSARLSNFFRGVFAPSPLSLSAWATGPLSPEQLAAGWYFCKFSKPGGIFAI